MIFFAAENPLEHVVDVRLLSGSADTGPFSTLLSMHIVTMAFVCVLLVITMRSVAKSMEQGQASDGAGRYLTKGRFAQAVEAICVYLRDDIVRPQLGDATDRFIGYLWTIFFFLLFSNILGLIPILDVEHLLGIHTTPFGGAITSNIAITTALAVIAFVVVHYNGVRQLGLKSYLHHYTAGSPAYLWFLMIPVEIMGTFIKPFALSVRLFANMVAGHTLIATLLMFTAMGLEGAGLVVGGGITVVALVGAFPLMLLEVLVAFIQAFIFMMLTAVFIAQLMPHDHHEETGHNRRAEDSSQEASVAVA